MLDFKVVPQIIVEFLQGFDQEIVDGKPDRPAPVGVAAEDARAGLGGSMPCAFGNFDQLSCDNVNGDTKCQKNGFYVLILTKGH